MQELQRPIAGFQWDRINWHRIGIAIGVAILIAASVVLYRILHDIEPHEVIDALRNKEAAALVLAALLVAGGYLTLTCYDYFALRTIGRSDVPYRIAAMAGFTSYSIGHNVGFSLFSGGTVRYRIYSTASGLTAIEVAKICFIAGLTFWLGNIAVLGFGLAIAPEAATAVDRLPPYLNRMFGLSALVALVAYVIWISLEPRRIGRDSWHVILPSGRLTLLQIFIGVVDLTCCAAAMYVLMPDQPEIGFIPLAVIFIAATLLGFASHTPGGFGVFDVAMLVALSQFDKEELVGSLLLFRLFYYIVPFVLSLAIVGIRELIVDIKPLIEKSGHSTEPAAQTHRDYDAHSRAEPASPAAPLESSAPKSTKRGTAPKPP
jgi:uncharacterized membrane protein YbhN (UPF0104 family)